VFDSLRQRRSIEHWRRTVRLPDKPEDSFASRISRKPSFYRPHLIHSRLSGEIPVEHLVRNGGRRVVGDRHLTTKHTTRGFLTPLFQKAGNFFYGEIVSPAR
jgi:hypothetical protein